MLNISRIFDDFPHVFHVVPMLGTCYNKNNFAQNVIGLTKKVQQFMKNGAYMSTENKTLLQARHMILIGATGRNSGKTTLALQIIHAFKDVLPVVAFKLITIRDHGDICPRGGKGCGICQGLKGSFDITPETGTGTKDTMLLKKAGANQVYLIRAYKENLREALEEALKLVPKNALVLCESNSVRLVAEPALFVMIQSSTSSSIKPTAEAVMDYADVILPQDEVRFENFVQGELNQKLKLNFSELNQ